MSTKVILYMLLTGVILVTMLLIFRKPLLERIWDEDVRVLAKFTDEVDGSVTIDKIRDWTYSIGEVKSKDYISHTYNPSDLESVWFYEQVLDSTGLIAHTFLVFDFGQAYEENRYLGISVETRREQGEKYSLVRGLLQGFELTHTWATEKDLVTRRVLFLDYDLTRYKLNVPREYLEPIFRQFVSETQNISQKPLWYNTITNNCTNSLISYINKLAPVALSWHYSFVLTGHLDNYLIKHNYIKNVPDQYIDRAYLQLQPSGR